MTNQINKPTKKIKPHRILLWVDLSCYSRIIADLGLIPEVLQRNIADLLLTCRFTELSPGYHLQSLLNHSDEVDGGHRSNSFSDPPLDLDLINSSIHRGQTVMAAGRHFDAVGFRRRTVPCEPIDKGEDNSWGIHFP